MLSGMVGYVIGLRCRGICFIICILACLSTISIPLNPALAKNRQIEVGTISTPQLTVHFESNLLPRAKKLLDVYPTVRSELEESLGLKLSFHPELLLVREETFRDFNTRDTFVAFAVPEEQLIVIDNSRIEKFALDAAMVLKHETCHLALHDAVPKGLPKWLDEGICQSVSKGISELLAENRDTVLQEAVLSGNIIHMKNLAERFPESREGSLLAYEESRSFIDYIQGAYGPGSLKAILEQLVSNGNLEEGFRKAFSASFEDVERAWRKDLTRKFTWPYYLSIYLDEILFVLAALITIAAAVKLALRRRKNRLQSDQDS